MMSKKYSKFCLSLPYNTYSCSGTMGRVLLPFCLDQLCFGLVFSPLLTWRVLLARRRNKSVSTSSETDYNNPFMPDGISKPYQVDKSISNLTIRWGSLSNTLY